MEKRAGRKTARANAKRKTVKRGDEKKSLNRKEGREKILFFLDLPFSPPFEKRYGTIRFLSSFSAVGDFFDSCKQYGRAVWLCRMLLQALLFFAVVLVVKFVVAIVLIFVVVFVLVVVLIFVLVVVLAVVLIFVLVVVLAVVLIFVLIVIFHCYNPSAFVFAVF